MSGGDTREQRFSVAGKGYKNIIANYGAGKGNKLIIGAHYDAVSGSPGADDNASGVAALLVLGGVLGGLPNLVREVELVAYTLEEPPFFGSKYMGSAIHACNLSSEATKPVGVIVLDSIGYFSSEHGSQIDSILLGTSDVGDFISVAGRTSQAEWVNRVASAMQAAGTIPVEIIIRDPNDLPAVDFSDHSNYYEYGIPSLLVTDTAFCRNPTYHTAADKCDLLDFGRLSGVVCGLLQAVTLV